MVKKLIILLLCIPFYLQARSNFTEWFTSGCLRVDYVMAGDKDATGIFLVKIYKEPWYGGPTDHLIDTMNYGNYFFEVRDSISDLLLYSRGFNTLFGEWQTTGEAATKKKAFQETIQFPYPKKTVQLIIYKRPSLGASIEEFSCFINPDDILIEKKDPPKYTVTDIQITGDPVSKVDLVYIAEGYTAGEKKKFLNDVKRFNDVMFRTAPYDANRDRFNVRAIFSVSENEGADIPGQQEWKNTVLNSHFYTFYSERYLTTSDYWKLMDIASAVPWDQVIVLVNTSKYGGGGIYNHYCLFSSHNESSEEVFVHEFGHSFAGLGDEYYTSSVSYSDYYDLTKEPWEPNLTTLVNFDRKWKNMVHAGVPIPTPQIEEYEDVVGVFEGGGYSAKGIYRPQIDCRMKSNRAKGFCKVCQKVIRDMIKWYSENTGSDPGSEE